MLSDEELVIYELGLHLHMPIYKLADEMTYEELLGWMNYFERRPIGWRDDDRVFKILQTQGVKGNPWSHFPSLKPIYSPVVLNNDTNGIKNLRNSVLYHKMLSATGGDQVDILKELE